MRKPIALVILLAVSPVLGFVFLVIGFLFFVVASVGWAMEEFIETGLFLNRKPGYWEAIKTPYKLMLGRD